MYRSGDRLIRRDTAEEAALSEFLRTGGLGQFDCAAGSAESCGGSGRFTVEPRLVTDLEITLSSGSMGSGSIRAEPGTAWDIAEGAIQVPAIESQYSINHTDESPGEGCGLRATGILSLQNLRKKPAGWQATFRWQSQSETSDCP